VGPACQREKESERARAAGPRLGFAGPRAKERARTRAGQALLGRAEREVEKQPEMKILFLFFFQKCV
jgi:hypothetical protein